MDPTWEWTRIIQFHIYFLNHIHQSLNLFSSPFVFSNLVQSQLRICYGFLFYSILFYSIYSYVIIFLAATHELYYYSFSMHPSQPLTSRRLVSLFYVVASYVISRHALPQCVCGPRRLVIPSQAIAELIICRFFSPIVSFETFSTHPNSSD